MAENMQNSDNVIDNERTVFDSVNCFFFGLEANDSRSRRLIEVLQPDMIHRGIFEWVGTHFSDIDWKGAKDSIEELHSNGCLVMGGVSGRWWKPDVESGPATVDEAIREVCSIKDSMTTEYRQLNIYNQTAIDQLIYKAKKQIDAGVDGIELDEFGDQLGNEDDSYIKSALAVINNELKRYAEENYGRKLYISTNAKIGGNDYPLLTGTNNDGSEPVDYYLRMLPYRLISDFMDITSYDHYDGTFNFIPYLRAAHCAVLPKRFYYFVDFAGKEFYTAPHRMEEWPNFLRISSAQVLASGGFPGYFRSYYNNLDCLETGLFQHVANLSKFIKDNAELWHKLTYINPPLSISMDKIYASVFEQEGRTVLHLVNGNFNNITQEMTSVSNFSISISLSATPDAIWMTTPDKPSSARKCSLQYTYCNGTAAILIPYLAIHNVIIIEQGTIYDPIYAPLKIRFPFPLPEQIICGNKLKITAVATGGLDRAFYWYVNNILGGNNTIGTIDPDGVYTAPAVVPDLDTVVIKAVSKVDVIQSSFFSIKVIPEPSLPWMDDFETDMQECMPSNWYIVDGRGDWKVVLDSDIKVLHNHNISEGNGDGNLREIALYNAFIVCGSQNWTDYSYNVSVKPSFRPIYYYGIPSGSFIGLVFRYKDPGNYYNYTISPDNKARLFKNVNGTITQIGNATEVNFIFINQYTELRVDAYRDNFRFYVNSILIRDDKDTTFSSGAIGLKVSFTDAMYKNICIKPVKQFFSAFNALKVDNCDNFNYICDRSTNITIDMKSTSCPSGDSGRLVRNNGSVGFEYVTYNISNKSSMKITAYFWTGEPLVHFKFYISDNSLNWTEIMPDITVKTEALPGWYTVIYDVSMLPVSAKFLKILWQNTNTSWSPRVGRCVFEDIVTRTIIDTCDDLKVDVFSRSYDIGVDSSNPDYFNGDMSRYSRIRGGQSAEWLTYAYTDIFNARFVTYFWSGEEISHFKFYLSEDHATWMEVVPYVTIKNGILPDWSIVTYEISVLESGINYLKIAWQNNDGQSWSPQIGDVFITHRCPHNLINNPGFESGTEFWNLPTNFTVTNEEWYLGERSLKLTTLCDNTYAFQKVDVCKNTNYTLTFYAKCEATSSFKILSTEGNHLASISIPESYIWTRYSLDFNSSNNNSIILCIMDTARVTGKLLYFDEIQIR